MTHVIGLIGGIGCGKSTVANAFLPYGAILFDADRSGHAALYDSVIKGAIEARWGKTVFTPTGNVSRPALAEIVFSNEEELKYLNQLIHPFIIKQFLSKFQEAQATGVRFFILDAPLLLETGMDRYCDHIIFIDANETVRAERVAKRGWSITEFNNREQNQFSLEKKQKKADYVIDNNETVAIMRKQVDSIIAKLSVLP